MIEEYTLERIKSDVSRYFPFYDFKVEADGLTFFCNVREDTIDQDFNRLRESLSEYNFIPILRKEDGEYILHVVKRKERKEKPLWINILLLTAVIITTTMTGSLLVSNKMSVWDYNAINELFQPRNIMDGFLQFSLPLLSILGFHEMSHYYVSKYHGVKASLPFFIPIPPILLNINIGTFGALISSKDPIPDRKALFDIGISGPLAGFLIAIPISIYGILKSTPVTLESTSDQIVLQPPLLFYLIIDGLLHLPKDYILLLHPTAFAGWVGLIVTSVNLFPIGQLDGGHIARAVFGDNQRYVGWLSVIFLMFTGWLFFALLIALAAGVYHPPPLNDLSRIDRKRKFLFVIAMIVLALCFVSFPIYQ